MLIVDQKVIPFITFMAVIIIFLLIAFTFNFIPVIKTVDTKSFRNLKYKHERYVSNLYYFNDQYYLEYYPNIHGYKEELTILGTVTLDFNDFNDIKEELHDLKFVAYENMIYNINIFNLKNLILTIENKSDAPKNLKFETMIYNLNDTEYSKFLTLHSDQTVKIYSDDSKIKFEIL